MGDVLGGDARVELIEGEIVEMAPIGARHARCVNRLTRLLVVAVGDRAEVSPQNPVELDEHSEAQPDLALLRPSRPPTPPLAAATSCWWSRSPTPPSRTTGR